MSNASTRAIIKDRAEPEVSVIVPTYNESTSIGSLIDEIENAMIHNDTRFEIIIVDDGSEDLTWEVAKNKGATIFYNPTFRGKGEAVRMGLSQAKGDIIVTLDGNGMFDPKEIPSIMEPILKNEADLVIGSRFSRGSRIRPYAISPRRRIANMLINVFIWFLTGRHFSDTQSSFKAYRKDALAKLTTASKGYEAETEVIFNIISSGLTCKEVPISYRTRQAIYIPKFRDMLTVLRATLVFGLKSQAR